MADDEFERLVAASAAAFDAAASGQPGVDVPPYTVGTDPDGSFVVRPEPPDLDEIGRALVAGDVRRRFLVEIETGVDGFAGLRRG